MASFHTLSVNAQLDSKIEDLSLYLNHAQLTRIFRVKIVAGQNKVCVRSLPNVVDGESIRYHQLTNSSTPILIQYLTFQSRGTGPCLDSRRNRVKGGDAKYTRDISSA